VVFYLNALRYSRNVMVYTKKVPSTFGTDDLVASPRPRYLIQSQKDYEVRNQARKQFFNELVNDFGYRSEQIVFNSPIPGLQSSVAADVVVYEDDNRQRVFCVADVMPVKQSGLPVDQLAEVVDKARRCGSIRN
jgi:hypothetical protein